MPIFQTQNVSRWFMAEACSACVNYVLPHILFGVNPRGVVAMPSGKNGYILGKSYVCPLRK